MAPATQPLGRAQHSGPQAVCGVEQDDVDHGGHTIPGSRARYGMAGGHRRGLVRRFLRQMLNGTNEQPCRMTGTAPRVAKNRAARREPELKRQVSESQLSHHGREYIRDLEEREPTEVKELRHDRLEEQRALEAGLDVDEGRG